MRKEGSSPAVTKKPERRHVPIASLAEFSAPPRNANGAPGNPTRRAVAKTEDRKTQAGFLAQIMHQPFGEISPSTFLQDDGAWNRTQSSHFLPSFGSG